MTLAFGMFRDSSRCFAFTFAFKVDIDECSLKVDWNTLFWFAKIQKFLESGILSCVRVTECGLVDYPSVWLEVREFWKLSLAATRIVIVLVFVVGMPLLGIPPFPSLPHPDLLLPLCDWNVEKYSPKVHQTIAWRTAMRVSITPQSDPLYGAPFL